MIKNGIFLIAASFILEYSQTQLFLYQNHGPKEIRSVSCIKETDNRTLSDIIECDDTVAITIEVPGVEKDDIVLNVTEDNLEITVDVPDRKYHKILNLPSKVKPKTTKATYKNGILDVVLDKKEKKKDSPGYKVDIE